MYEEILKIDGVEFLRATSGESALEICRHSEGIQVIISDSRMGAMSGMEFLKNLRSYYQTPPVFYLLTGSFEIRESDVINEGGKGLIVKPFDLNDFLERIKREIKF